MLHKPALVLDLDGTVRRPKSGRTFSQSPDDVELVPGIEKRIVRAKEMGFMILGISNQGGVAHGFKTPTDVEEELRNTCNLFRDGNPFDFVEMCFAMEGAPVQDYNYRSLLRKPGYGMLALMEYKALVGYGVAVDWSKSLFVGDRPEDEQCAQAAGIPFLHITKFINLPLVFPREISGILNLLNNG